MKVLYEIAEPCIKENVHPEDLNEQQRISLDHSKIQNARLREMLQKFADIDIDFIAKDEPFRALILEARVVLEEK